ncbi:hypothetical protein DEO72_LG10g2232 [Vigna unguiculata]|uniref:Uncharacterized protein n=1 Tax=Vigna unguiculata TaxID=3917 RepID=A0A4D6NEM3_VIGUN|nr:hypothetical protein DEO72_LG10g2232 [Vigna unguiculata]
MNSRSGAMVWKVARGDEGEGEVYCLGEDVSRSGESFSPKRECEERSKGSLNIQPKREMRVLAKRDLAQASVTRLSEGSWRELDVKPREGWMTCSEAKWLQYWIDWYLSDDEGFTMFLRYLDGELVGVPWVVARNRMNTRNLELWLGLASVPVECAGCGQYGWVQMDCPPHMVPARALSVVANRTGTRFSDILHYAWWWPCGGKVTSLPRGVSMYMVVAM